MSDDRITVVVGKKIKSLVKMHCAENNILIKEYIIQLIMNDLKK